MNYINRTLDLVVTVRMIDITTVYHYVDRANCVHMNYQQHKGSVKTFRLRVVIE